LRSKKKAQDQGVRRRVGGPCDLQGGKRTAREERKRQNTNSRRERDVPEKKKSKKREKRCARPDPKRGFPEPTKPGGKGDDPEKGLKRKKQGRQRSRESTGLFSNPSEERPSITTGGNAVKKV